MTNPLWQWKKISYEFVEYSSPILKEILHFKKCPYEQQTQMTIEKLDISMSKKFIYFPNEGWSWHKIWNIPSIHIDLQMKQDFDSNKNFFVSYQYFNEISKNFIKMGLYLIKKIEENEEILMNLDLTGNTIVKLTENSKQDLQFSSIKINTTSFCHNGERFQLLLTLFEKCCQRKTCLFSVISPEFLVDSRELSKNNSNSKLKNISLFIEPFAPGFVTKEFIKRENRIMKEKQDIENSLDGLYHYLSAPNIKFKIKHPLFLLFKFSTVFSLYYKPINFGKENVIEKIQKTIMHNYKNFLVKKNFGKKKNEDFIFFVKEFNVFERRQKHKLTDLISFLNNNFITIARNTSEIPPLYEEYKDLVLLRKIYKKTFNKLNSNNLFSHIKSQRLPVKKQLLKRLEKNKEEIFNKKVKPDECSSHNINLISKSLQKVSIAKNIEFSTFSQKNQIQIISSVHSKIQDNTIKEEKLNSIQDEKKLFEYPIKLKNKFKKIENCIENYYGFLFSILSKPFQAEIRLF